jgi:polar amino acid transport system substrate-binding protein
MGQKTARAALAAIAMLAFGAHSQAAEKVIKFGAAAEPYPPFTSQDSTGKWVGFEVDLMNAVCAEEHLKCMMVGTAWDGIIPALNAHKIDVIWSSMSITAERKKVINFSDKYYNTPAEIIAPKSETLKLGLHDYSAMKGKTLGVQVSTTHANFARKYMGSDVTVKTYDTQDNANADLAAGRVDAVVADSITLDDFLKSDAGKCCDVKLIIPGDFDPSVFGDGVGAGVRKADKKLLGELNDGIKKVRADGTYDKIAKKYFSFDVYGS